MSYGLILVDCPGCGKERCVVDGDLCGECMQKFSEEHHRYDQEEIARLRKEIDSCVCSGGEGCGVCLRKLARIRELEGDYEGAVQLLNM